MTGLQYHPSAHLHLQVNTESPYQILQVFSTSTGNLVRLPGLTAYVYHILLSSLLSRILPRKGHRSSLIPSLTPNLSGIFILAPHPSFKGRLRLTATQHRGVKATSSCSNFPPPCNPGTAWTRLRFPQQNPSKFIVYAWLSFLAPWGPWLLWFKNPELTPLCFAFCSVTPAPRPVQKCETDWTGTLRRRIKCWGHRNRLTFKNILPL